MDPVVAGRVPGADGQPRTWPNVSFQFRNVTALQALAVVLEAHGLALAWNPPLGSGRVTTRERRAWELAHPVAGAASPAALSSLTNTQPLIFIDEAPLEEAARSLSQSLGLNLMFDPSLGSHPPPGGPLMVEGKFRNVTFAQALLGLLENHGLVMLWDPAARLGRVTTWTRAWEEGQRPKNSALPATVGQGTVIPRVQFTQTPLSAVLTALARLAQVNLVLAPELTGETAAGSASALGQTEIDVDWVNVTARQALLAVAANYGLALTWDEAAQKLRVQPPPPGR
jgi:hypothetical protein